MKFIYHSLSKIKKNLVGLAYSTNFGVIILIELSHIFEKLFKIKLEGHLSTHEF